MSNIVDIARSSIAAYRTALGITGENIANVNTEGYRRREVTTSQIGGARTTVTTLATGGQGVQVDQIRRAFDQLLTERLRNATGDVSASQTALDAAKAVEAQLLPNSGGIDVALENFFSAMGNLASSPADSALRRVAIESGRGLAFSFQNVAGGLLRLRDDTVAEVKMAASGLTADLRALSELQQRFSSNTGTVGALNPLMDERDRLLASISARVGCTVDYDKIGRARVTLGTGGGGPELLGFDGPATVTASADPDLTLSIALAGTLRETRLFGSGSLGGYRAALGGIDTALQEVDALARKMAGEMNAVHRMGLDLTGAPGGDMFALDGWQVTPAAGNQGRARLVVTADGTANPGPISLTRDAALGLWQARDATGTLLGQADKLLVLPGLQVMIEGDPLDGDRFSLDPVAGKAAYMRFLPQTPSRLAAAVATLVAPSPGNAGSATAAMAPTTVAPPALPALPDLLASATDAAHAVTLRAAGVVGFIPAGSAAVRLASLGQQAMAEFATTPGDALTALSVTVAGATTSFDLTRLADGSARPAAWGTAEIAAALNDGRLTEPGGETLSGLGITAAAGAGGTLSLALADGDFTAARLTGATDPAARLTASAPQGGALQVFTREGRQIAGPPLSAAEAALLLTPQNGFLPGAQYVTSYLNAPGGVGYRGLTQTTTLGSGQQGLSLTPAAPLGWSGRGPAPANPAQSVSLDAGLGLPITFTLPEGGTARRLAALLTAQMPGATATAQTTATLTASGDGRVEFALAGRNTTPLSVGADVAGGRLDALALAVNALTGATGISAQLSPDGTRLMLTQAEGEDIALTGLTRPNGGTLSVQPTDPTGQAKGAALTLGAGAENARLTGQVDLHAPTRFAVTLGGLRQDSASDALAGGLISRQTSDAGATARLTFALDPALDASAGQDAALSGPTRYGLTLAGRSVTLDTASARATDAGQVAAGLAAALRKDMPQASLLGGALAQLPAEGASTLLRVDGQDYVLRMTGGAVSVTGPEADRVSASFGADMRLAVTVNGGSTDAAMIALPSGSNAAAFGLSPAQGGVTRLTGQPVPGPLPASLTVDIGGTRYGLSVSPGPAVTLPAGFPGTASLDAVGAITLSLPIGAGAARILPGGAAAGFDSLGTTLSAQGPDLTASTLEGGPLALTATSSSLAGQRLSLSNLPPEDLIVTLSGSGMLRLAGAVTAGTPPATQPAVELRVTDAATRRVELFDLATGHSIATRTLDASGGAVMGGLSISVTGNPATGDGFRLTANADGKNDGRALDAILSLRFPDQTTGKGGFARILSDLQSEVGTRASAADTKLKSDSAIHDTVRRADAAQGAVDLDREAARLLELQQAYQASAQIMTVAKDLFDTLLRAL